MGLAVATGWHEGQTHGQKWKICQWCLPGNPKGKALVRLHPQVAGFIIILLLLLLSLVSGCLQILTVVLHANTCMTA